MATYKIKSGDTLSQIAKKYNTTIRTLQKNNNIKDPNKIKAGKTLDLGPLKPGLSSQRKMSPYAGQSPSEMRSMAMKKNKKVPAPAKKPKAIAAKPTKRPAAIGKKKLTGTAGRRQRRMTRRA